MSKLSAAQRKKMPRSEFALPGGRFPVEDKGHAKAALEDVSFAKGLSAGQKATVKRRAHEELAKPGRKFGQLH